MARSASLVAVLWVLIVISESRWAVTGASHCNQMGLVGSRRRSVRLTEFGAIGDGITLNTRAFKNALFYLNSMADNGGVELFVPAGRWLTGSFPLISHLTLSLDKDAVILGSTDPLDWPVIDHLPWYGRGRELSGQRHQSLIHGYNLTDVIITGDNGTINGQGNVWWDLLKNASINHTLPHLVELMHSKRVTISNLTFRNSPFSAIHPVYCSKVQVENVTIIAPFDSSNTNGIDSDSSSNICIRDCYISTGNDLITIKSELDANDISIAHPSSNISIRGIVGEAGSGSGIAFGSDMSGGLSEIEAKDIHLFNSYNGIRIETAPGRGGYVRNLYISDVTMASVHIAIKITGQYGDHPDASYNQIASSPINRISITDVFGVNINVAGHLEGIKGDNFSSICLSNILLNVTSDHPWKCSNIRGYSYMVYPESCELLQRVRHLSSTCYEADESFARKFSTDNLISPY